MPSVEQILAKPGEIANEWKMVAVFWHVYFGAIVAAVLFVYGWIYPHFLGTISFLPYLFAAPLGLIPCATLVVVIVPALILNGLGPTLRKGRLAGTARPSL